MDDWGRGVSSSSRERAGTDEIEEIPDSPATAPQPAAQPQSGPQPQPTAQEGRSTRTTLDPEAKPPDALLHESTEDSDSFISDSVMENRKLKFGWKTNLITLTFISALVFGLTLAGAAILQAIEKGAQADVSEDPCLNKTRAVYSMESNNSHVNIKSQYTFDEVRILLHQTIDEVGNCTLESKRLENMADNFVFVWSLYTTVGYGDQYPLTEFGRGVSVLFGMGGSTLYLAAEFGMMFAIFMGWTIDGVRKLLRICCTKKTGKSSEKYALLSPFHRFTICVVLFFILVSIFTLYIKFLESWDWYKAFYFTYITATAIGLGDIVPNEKKRFMGLAIIVMLVCDSMYSQINWYLQNRMRAGFHGFLRKYCVCLTTSGDEDGPTPCTPVPNAYPNMTNKMMPLFGMKGSESITRCQSKREKKARRSRKAKRRKERKMKNTEDTNTDMLETGNEIGNTVQEGQEERAPLMGEQEVQAEVHRPPDSDVIFRRMRLDLPPTESNERKNGDRKSASDIPTRPAVSDKSNERRKSAPDIPTQPNAPSSGT